MNPDRVIEKLERYYDDIFGQLSDESKKNIEKMLEEKESMKK